MNTIQFWDDWYSKETFLFGKDESISARKAAEEMKKKNLKTVLDIGCAHGRDTTYLAKQGFEVTGTDISKVAIDTANKLAKESGLNARHFVDNIIESRVNMQFDAIISFNTYHLFLKADRVKIKEKIYSLLKVHGIIVFTVFSTSEEQYGKGEKCEEANTFMTKGKPNHYFSEEELRDEFSDKFKIISIEMVEITEEHGGRHNHKLYTIIGEKR